VSTLLTGLLSGCTSFLADGGSLIPWFEGETVLPTRMNTFWSNTVLQEPGKPGVRGMGGRVMFYTSQNKEPITVEGTLTVYAYDQTEEKRVEPARKYVFSADQIAKHYSKSDLGHSYSFWLPWSETDGPPKRLTLIARFEPTEGGAVLSDPAQQHLPGISPEPLEDQSASGAQPSDPTLTGKGAIRPVQHVAAASSDQASSVQAGSVQTSSDQHSPPSSHRSAPPGETITIDVPPSFIHGHAKLPTDSKESPDSSNMGNSIIEGLPIRQKIFKETEASSSHAPTASQGEAESSNDLQQLKDSAQNASMLRPAGDPQRTRRRLQAWLSERRPSRKVGPRGVSGLRR
jgi:hypothetical protein